MLATNACGFIETGILICWTLNYLWLLHTLLKVKNVIYKFPDIPFWLTITSQWLEIQCNAGLQ